MSANVTPFTEELKKLGLDGMSLNLFPENLFDEEQNEEEDHEGDALCAAVFALIAEEAEAEQETIEDFCVPEGFVPPKISKNVFSKKAYKTAEKNFKKSSKSKVVKPKTDDGTDRWYKMYMKMKVAPRVRKPKVSKPKTESLDV